MRKFSWRFSIATATGYRWSSMKSEEVTPIREQPIQSATTGRDDDDSLQQQEKDAASAPSFGELLRQGMEEEAHRRRQDKHYYLPVSPSGVVSAIELGGAPSLAKCQDPEERKGQKKFADEHLGRCVLQLGEEEVNCGRIYPELHRRNWSLLHCAAYHGNLEACRLLMRCQCRRETWGNALFLNFRQCSLSPEGLAIQRGQYQVARYLMLCRNTVYDGHFESILLQDLIRHRCKLQHLFWFWQFRYLDDRVGFANGARSFVSAAVATWPPRYLNKFLSGSLGDKWGIVTKGLLTPDLLLGICKSNRKRPLRILAFLEAVDTIADGTEIQDRLYNTLLDVCCRVNEPSTSPTKTLLTVKAFLKVAARGGNTTENFLMYLPAHDRATVLTGSIGALQGFQRDSPQAIESTLALLEFLLQNGADVNQYDGRGKVPLFVAVAKGLQEVAELLLKHGADPNLPAKGSERVPLDWLCQRGARERGIFHRKTKMRLLLLQHGADEKLMSENRSGSGFLQVKKRTCEIKRSLANEGLQRRIVPFNHIKGDNGPDGSASGPIFVRSSLSGTVTRYVTLELGDHVSQKKFSPKDDDIFYRNAYFALVHFYSKRAHWIRQDNPVKSADAILRCWCNVREKLSKNRIAELAEESEGTYTLSLSPLPYQPMFKANLRWRCAWEPENEEVLVPFVLGQSFHKNRKTMKDHLSEDRYTLYFEETLTEALESTMHHHNANVKKAALAESSRDLDMMQKMV